MIHAFPSDFRLPRFIGITGRAGVGKSTAAAFLRNTYKDVYEQSLADPLKEMCAAMTGIPIESFHDRESKELPHPFWRMSPREILQNVGTELVRNSATFGADFWINRLIKDLTLADENGNYYYNQHDTVVVPDVRFQNEYDWLIEQRAIILYITSNREGVLTNSQTANHASEHSLNLHAKERTIHVENNSTLKAFYLRLSNLMTDFLIAD